MDTVQLQHERRDDFITMGEVVTTEEEFEKKKKWLFRENIRLEQLKQDLQEQQMVLEDEKKVVDIQKDMMERQQRKSTLLKEQLENQKHLFDQKWQILERETRQLAIDREKFNRDKLQYKDKIYREARKSMMQKNAYTASGAKIFFTGVDNSDALKKRYKALLKIYHPDNANGDKELLQAINTEYENMVRGYLEG